MTQEMWMPIAKPTKTYQVNLKMLHDMAENYDLSFRRAPVIFNHTSWSGGKESYGYLKELKVEDNTLWGLAVLNELAVKMIQNLEVINVSMEATITNNPSAMKYEEYVQYYENDKWLGAGFERNNDGKVVGAYLQAIAMLGDYQPAIDSMPTLQDSLEGEITVLNVFKKKDNQFETKKMIKLDYEHQENNENEEQREEKKKMSKDSDSETQHASLNKLDILCAKLDEIVLSLSKTASSLSNIKRLEKDDEEKKEMEEDDDEDKKELEEKDDEEKKELQKKLKKLEKEKKELLKMNANYKDSLVRQGGISKNYDPNGNDSISAKYGKIGDMKW